MNLILQRVINGILTDGYYEGEEAWFTREQIGDALEYTDPRRQIARLHNRHKERLDKFSRVVKLTTPSGEQETYLYNRQGIMEICRWSRQPKANMVMDALYDMAEQVVKKGYYSTLTDEKLLQILAEKALHSGYPSAYVNSFKTASIKETIHKVQAEKAEELFNNRENNTYQSYRKALSRIYQDDMYALNKEWNRRLPEIKKLPNLLKKSI